MNPDQNPNTQEKREIYLDNSATTRVCPEAVAKITEMLTENYGNPSSLHAKGLQAQRELESARQAVAGALDVMPKEIYFTSGGTEANNLALFGAAKAGSRRGKRIVSTAIEHPSVLEPLARLEKEGFEVVLLQPDSGGFIPEESIYQAVNEQTVLVSLMAVNNEVGSIQPWKAARRAIDRVHAPALLHVDAVQAFGKLPLFPGRDGVDLMTVSAHKIHGPKGAGALYVSQKTHLQPRVFGGGQERNLRSGTEALPAIAGFGAAVRALPGIRQTEEQVASLCALCKEKLLAIPGVELNSPAQGGLPYLVNFSARGLRSETLLHFLENLGVYVSSGSACAKGKQSHVLTAMGLPRERVQSAIRVSFSRYNTPQDVDALAQGVAQGMATLARSR
ncbi:MAG TPA: cysteine desulfurase [Candidatus Gallacutalibacter stercoravium]|nr:cysteine desulfurase [Candidatus Gallacutalibacter stercoravium]